MKESLRTALFSLSIVIGSSIAGLLLAAAAMAAVIEFSGGFAGDSFRRLGISLSLLLLGVIGAVLGALIGVAIAIASAAQRRDRLKEAALGLESN
jgi:hypothetical protein